MSDDTRTWIKHASLGHMIRTVRRQRGMALRQFAEAGVFLDAGSLARIERGVRAVDYETVCRIADILRAPQIEAFAVQLILSQLRPMGPEAA